MPGTSFLLSTAPFDFERIAKGRSWQDFGLPPADGGP
jgi:hypothetical protein